MVEQEKRKCRYPGAQKSYFWKGAPGNARWTAGPAQPCKGLPANGEKVAISRRKGDVVKVAVGTLTSEKLDVSGDVCHVGKPKRRTNIVQMALENHGKLDIVVMNP